MHSLNLGIASLVAIIIACAIAISPAATFIAFGVGLLIISLFFLATIATNATSRPRLTRRDRVRAAYRKPKVPGAANDNEDMSLAA